MGGGEHRRGERKKERKRMWASIQGNESFLPFNLLVFKACILD